MFRHNVLTETVPQRLGTEFVTDYPSLITDDHGDPFWYQICDGYNPSQIPSEIDFKFL